MKLCNIPKTREEAVEGKIYWSLSIGRDAHPQMYFDNGWRAVHFTVWDRFDPKSPREAAATYKIRIAFAYWLPFYFLK